MNILYVSHLEGQLFVGPNYSVPAQVFAQSKYDNVFWYNLNSSKQDAWLKGGLFHNTEEFPQKKLSHLPEPFNHPDLVVFESFYYADDLSISCECRKNGIPYVIVPRSAFTHQAQKSKKIKKWIANFVFFKRFAKKALAIHYLTETEYKDSGASWNRNYFVEPNGIAMPSQKKQFTNQAWINGICIGRFDEYQKGLDLLLEACKDIREFLIKSRVRINLFGPERLGYKKRFQELVVENDLSEVIFVHDGVYGKDKEKELLNSDFFVMTSRFEGMPMSLIEALSYGLPCVVTKGSNMSDVVERYHAGKTCDTTSQDIASALASFVNEQHRFEEYSKNAIELASQYDWDSIASRSHDHYVGLLNRVV